MPRSTSKKQVAEIAAEIANNALQRAGALQRELDQIEARKLDIQAKLHAANLSLKRLANFQPEIGADLQCPRCWIEREIHSRMGPLRGTDYEDFFRCEACHYEISVPFH